jgi:uncharacterized membrane protein YecN with MAPEG domain
MPVAVTALYAGILALIVTALAINVTAHRVRLGVSLGDGGKPQMQRMIRIHGNTVEYLPLGIVLMGLYELNGGARLPLHACGIALILGRLLFIAGVWNSDGPNLVRATSMTVT